MENKIPKEIRDILGKKHDDILEYVEECLFEHEEESAEDELKKVNVIRKFLGMLPPITIIGLKKDMILEKLR